MFFSGNWCVRWRDKGLGLNDFDLFVFAFFAVLVQTRLAMKG